jgi:hypothetical protein
MWQKNVNWMDVESISLIQFVYPPLFRIKVKGSGKTFWFNSENQFVNAVGYISDLSEIVNLIMKKKRELCV